MTQLGILRVGDTVLWRGAWGTRAPRRAVVVGIDRVAIGEKYGDDVREMPWERVALEAVVTLDNEHWAYGEQISPLEEAGQ